MHDSYGCSKKLRKEVLAGVVQIGGRVAGWGKVVIGGGRGWMMTWSMKR